MRNAECRMRNVGKTQRRIATLTSSNASHFSIHNSAFIIILFLAFFLTQVQHLTAAESLDPFYHPYDVEPDTTKMIFPIPVNTGNPLQDLNNQSPLYLSDPDNFTTEIINISINSFKTFAWLPVSLLTPVASYITTIARSPATATR